MQQDGETGSGSDDTILKKPVVSALAAVGLLALLGSLVGATTIGPNHVTTNTFNTTGTAISFNDNLTLNDNNLTGGEIVEADQFTTVHNTSLAAINEALSKYDYVKLRPTAYSGDTQVLLNVSSSKTGDKVLDASGAKIDCSQLSKTCLLVTGNTFNTKASVIGGHWRGPTPSGDMMGSKGIEVRDIPSAIVEPRRVEGFDYGIYLNNVNSWTEGTKVDVRRGNDNNYTLVFNGSINSAGTHSFKATDVNIDFAHPRNATMWALNDAKIYDSEIDVSGFFAYDNVVGIHLENISGMHGTILRPKFEDAGTVNSNTKGMVIDQLPTSPIMMHPNFASNLDTRIENNAANELIEIDHAAQDVLDLKANNVRAKGTVEIHEGSSGDFSIWQDFRDKDETIRFQFASNDQDDFRLLAKQTDQDVIFKNEINGHTWMTLQSSNDTKINSGNLVINGANQWIETPSTGNISHVDDGTGKSGQHYSTDKSMNFFIDQKGSSTDFRSFNFYEGGSDIGDSNKNQLMRIDELGHVMMTDNYTSVGDFYDLYEVTPQGNEDAIIVKGVDDPSDDASLVLQGREDSGTGDQIADLSFHNKGTNVASLNAKENNEINIKGGTFHVRTDNGMKLHGEMDANSNDINDVRYTNHTVQSGNLNTCDSTWEGATAYNGTHWGCDGSSWNKLY